MYPLFKTLDPLHVTLYYTTLDDDIYDEQWRKVDGQTFHITYTCLYLGPQGMAIQAALPKDLQLYYRSKNSVPHVSLAVTKHHQPEQLGLMVRFYPAL